MPDEGRTPRGVGHLVTGGDRDPETLVVVPGYFDIDKPKPTGLDWSKHTAPGRPPLDQPHLARPARERVDDDDMDLVPSAPRTIRPRPAAGRRDPTKDTVLPRHRPPSMPPLPPSVRPVPDVVIIDDPVPPDGAWKWDDNRVPAAQAATAPPTAPEPAAPVSMPPPAVPEAQEAATAVDYSELALPELLAHADRVNAPKVNLAVQRVELAIEVLRRTLTSHAARAIKPGRPSNNPELCRHVVALYESDKSQRTIAAETGLSPVTIRKILRAADVTMRVAAPPVRTSGPEGYPPAIVTSIRSLYAGGLSQAEVGKIIGRSQKYVSTVMNVHDIPRRSSGNQPGWRSSTPSPTPEGTS